MGKHITKIEKSFIESTGKLSKQWGLGEPTGKVWAALLFSGTPLSQKQIAEKTSYSLSLISPCLKILERLSMVKAARGQGREKLYKLQVSFTEAFHNFVRSFLEEDIKPLIEKLEEIKKGKHANARIAKLIKEYRNLEFHLDLFTKLLLMKDATAGKISKLLG